MRDELIPLWTSIQSSNLPTQAAELFGSGWDQELQRFQLQETYLIDYKDRVPPKFSDDFGASIVRLCLGFHNSFGGLVVFGVTDGTFEPSGQAVDLDIEALNRVIGEVTGKPLECLFRKYRLPGSAANVGVLLVPKRGATKPLRLTKPLGPYRSGALWVRERHEVIEATASHLPMLYTARHSPPAEIDVGGSLPIHRSFPPSPATMQHFVGRDTLMAKLWDWIAFSDQPRAYLHGPGGSGKSTLAFEFARTIADVGFDLVAPDGERIDYVLFLSAKETEFNPHTGEQQIFAMRQFEDATTQFKQILFHSGHFDAEALEAADEPATEALLEELFSTYNGLIVLDDIDALSRRKVDTGEEALFFTAVRKGRRTRILYTLRYPPSHASRNAMEVPGLDDDEFSDFLEACCEQFETKVPPAELIPNLREQTQSLPLLIETVVGFNRFCSTYVNALALFRDKGGDEARSYLYQREYDRLESLKSKEILAALYLMKEPVQSSTLVNFMSMTDQRVDEALSECASIFLTISEGPNAETLYQLTAPCRPFIRTVSRKLDLYDQIERKVEAIRKQGGHHTAAEAAIIVEMKRMLQREDLQGVIALGESLDPHDPSLGNPTIHALLGRAYANSEGKLRERGRECFRRAYGLGLRDLHMMRGWYFLEMESGYGTEEAKRVCRLMIEGDNVTQRGRSEFLSKLGRCLAKEATSLRSVSREKAVPLFREAVEIYIEALKIARSLPAMDEDQTLQWLGSVVDNFLRYLKGDLEPYLDMVEGLAAKKSDIGLDAASMMVEAIPKTYLPNENQLKQRLAGLFRRTSGKLERLIKHSDAYPGFSHMSDSFQKFSEALA